MTIAILYTTFADAEQARAFAAKVLEAELAACVNIVPGVRSLYRWEGAIQDEAEVIALVKTRSELRATLMTFARSIHPYDTPALLWFTPSEVDTGFADWIRSVTKEPSS